MYHMTLYARAMAIICGDNMLPSKYRKSNFWEDVDVKAMLENVNYDFAAVAFVPSTCKSEESEESSPSR
eukprot:gene13518-3950_t